MCEMLGENGLAANHKHTTNQSHSQVATQENEKKGLYSDLCTEVPRCFI